MSNRIRKENWQSLKPTVCGWGINDVNYRIRITEELPSVDSKRKQKLLFKCPYYEDWYNMILRVNSKKVTSVRNGYEQASITESWRYLSNFIEWVDSQPNRDWQNCELDKDILISGNKLYSEITCIYIPQHINLFVTNSSKARGDYMLGVSLAGVPMSHTPYQATCSNPFVHKKGYKHHVGFFKTELEAHKAWQAKKHEYACKLAEQQQDPHVAKALRERYAPDKDWTKA